MTSATVTMNDIYVQATIGATNYVGGVVGSIGNNSGSNLVLNRAVVYATLTADTSYAGGIVGDNLSTKAQSLTNFIFTGVENSGSNRAGTIGNGTAMTYTNGWAAQWSSSTIAAYANMTGQSVPAATKYLAARSSLTTAWWSTNLNSIASNGKWKYSATNYLYYLKP